MTNRMTGSARRRAEGRQRRRTIHSRNRMTGPRYDAHGNRVGAHPGIVWGAFGRAKPADFERWAKGTTGEGGRAHLIETPATEDAS